MVDGGYPQAFSSWGLPAETFGAWYLRSGARLALTTVGRAQGGPLRFGWGRRHPMVNQ